MANCKYCENIKVSKNKDGINECPKCHSKFSEICISKGYELNECVECPYCDMMLCPEDIPCKHLIASMQDRKNFLFMVESLP